MKKITLLILFLYGTSFSQSYYLNIWVNGKATSILISDIKKLAFSTTTNIGGVEKEQTLISTFELFQNYPNPFNPTTKIEYQIANTGHVEVQIFNINGELVKTIVSTTQSAGKYSVNWNGRDNTNNPVASGIYIYRVAFGNSVLSKKMLLLK